MSRCNSFIISFVMFFILVTPGQAFAGWSRAYGGSGIDFGKHILECSDGNYAILGGTSSFGAGGGDIWLVKTDKKGDTLWTKTYGGTESEDTTKRGYVGQMVDKGYIVVGETESFGAGNNDLWILITDSLGDTVSTRTWGDSHYDRLCCANRTWWGYIIIEGSGMNFITLDSVGGEKWSSEYAQSQIILPWEITFVQKGHDAVVVAGSAYSYEPLSGPDPWSAEVICAPLEVIELWARTCLEYDFGIAYCIQPTKNDTGYVLTGKPWPIFKTSKTGILKWSKEYDGNGKYVIEASDGGYLVTGDLSGDLWLLKTDSNGDTLGITEPVTPPPPITQFEIANPIGSEITLRYSDCPNGFSASVYDATGRKVDELSDPNQSGALVWGSSQRPGVYFIVPHGEKASPSKVVLVK